jgi:hypothetical protein
MVVGHLAIAMMLFHALRAMDLVGRKIPSAIQGQQIRVIQKAKVFQSFAALQSREDISEGWPELFPVKRIKDFSHARVTGHALHVENHLQILFV